MLPSCLRSQEERPLTYEFRSPHRTICWINKLDHKLFQQLPGSLALYLGLRRGRHSLTQSIDKIRALNYLSNEQNIFHKLVQPQHENPIWVTLQVPSTNWIIVHGWLGKTGTFEQYSNHIIKHGKVEKPWRIWCRRWG